MLERGQRAWAWLQGVDMQEMSHIGDQDISWDDMLGGIRGMSKTQFLNDESAISTVEALQHQYLAFTGPQPRRRATRPRDAPPPKRVRKQYGGGGYFPTGLMEIYGTE